MAPTPAAFTQLKGWRGYIQHQISDKTGEGEEQVPQEGVTRAGLGRYEGRVPEESHPSWVSGDVKWTEKNIPGREKIPEAWSPRTAYFL